MAAQRKNYTVKVEHGGLNVREEPSKESRILRVLKNGEKVTVDPAADAAIGWFAVKGGGYVMGEFLD